MQAADHLIDLGPGAGQSTGPASRSAPMKSEVA